MRRSVLYRLLRFGDFFYLFGIIVVVVYCNNNDDNNDEDNNKVEDNNNDRDIRFWQSQKKLSEAKLTPAEKLSY